MIEEILDCSPPTFASSRSSHFFGLFSRFWSSFIGIEVSNEEECSILRILYCYSPGGGGGYSQKNWVGVCGLLLNTLTLFMTKICDIPYPFYDLTRTSKPYLCPDPYIKILFQKCVIIRSLVQINVKLL